MKKLKQVGIIGSVLLVGACTAGVLGSSPDTNTTPAPSETSQTSSATPTAEESTPTETPTEEVSYEFEAALSSAQSYVDFGDFSKKELVNQLKFEDHDDKAIGYAIENVEVDYNEEAIESLESYMDMGGMSKSELRTQLEYEGFTKDQVNKAIESKF